MLEHSRAARSTRTNQHQHHQCPPVPGHHTKYITDCTQNVAFAIIIGIRGMSVEQALTHAPTHRYHS